MSFEYSEADSWRKFWDVKMWQLFDMKSGIDLRLIRYL